MSKENAVLVGSDDAGLYNLDDAELQAYEDEWEAEAWDCLLYTSPSPRD